MALGSTQLSGAARVKISRISALSVRRIGRRLGAASPEDVARVLEGLNEILGA